MINDKKILMIIAPKDFRDAEYNEPRKIFDDNDMLVKVASINIGNALGVEGIVVPIDLTVSEANAEDYDAVVFIGGPGMAKIAGENSLITLAQKFFMAGKLTAAICIAPSILAKARILKGRNATAWPGAKYELIKGGANFVADSVVVDGSVITADGPQSAKAFGEMIISYLSNQ